MAANRSDRFRSRFVHVGLLILILASLFAILFPMRMEDDAYIYFRFARNWVARGEIAFNPGERLVGFTSLLHFLFLSAAGIVTDRLPEVAFGLGVLLRAIAVGLFALFLWQSALPFKGGSIRRQVMPLWLAFDSLLLATFGMESGWMEVATFALFLGYFGSRRSLALAMVGGLVWVRPDGLLLALVLFADAFMRERKFRWREVAASVAFVLVWLSFNRWAGGAWLPDTLAAKLAQGASGAFARSFGEKLFLRGFPRHEGQWGYYLILLALLSRFALACIRDETGMRRYLLIPIWGALYALAYSVLRVPYYYHWYYVPLILSMLATAGLGAVAWGSDAMGASRLGRISAAAVLFAAVIYPWVMLYAAIGDPHAAARQEATAAYHEAAKFIREQVSADQSVAMTEIGVTGDSIPNPVIDLMGIVTPEARAGIRSRDFEAIYRSMRPAYVLVHDPPSIVEAPAVTGAVAKDYEAIFKRYESTRQLRRLILLKRRP